LLGLGYAHTHADHTLYIEQSSTAFTALLVYVNDMLLVGNSMEEFSLVTHTIFGIKDLGLLKYFHGTEVAHSKCGISLCQRQYCLDLLSDAAMLNCKPVLTPLDPHIRLCRDDGNGLADAFLYRRLVGQNLYLTTTPPDIYFATQQLA
jgi:hypothetical protein